MRKTIFLILFLFLAAPALAEPEVAIRFNYPDGTLARPSGKPLRAIGSRVSLLLTDLSSQTVREQPTFYWYASGALQQVEHQLFEGENPKPLLHSIERNVSEAGFHALPLAKHGIRLKPGIAYRWLVILPPEGSGREAVRISGEIQRVTTPARLVQAAPERLPFILAETGLWCDLLDELSQRIGRDSDQARWLAARAHVLRQVGLDDAAQADEARFPLQVTLSADKPVWRSGEPIMLTLHANKRFHARLIFAHENGQRILILPVNSSRKRNVFEGQKTHRFPGTGDAPLEMVPPLGRGQIILQASSRELDVLAGEKLPGGWIKLAPDAARLAPEIIEKSIAIR